MNQIKMSVIKEEFDDDLATPLEGWNAVTGNITTSSSRPLSTTTTTSQSVSNQLSTPATEAKYNACQLYIKEKIVDRVEVETVQPSQPQPNEGASRNETITQSTQFDTQNNTAINEQVASSSNEQIVKVTKRRSNQITATQPEGPNPQTNTKRKQTQAKHSVKKTKKAIDDNAQPEVIDESSGQPTDLDLDAQPNQMNKQFITVHLKCLLSNCLDTFPEDQLNQHMLEKHDIRPLRCLVKDCTQSFDNTLILGDHIKQAHPHTTEWHCDKCSQHFMTYQRLCIHNTRQHQLGLFQCSFPACTFTGENRSKVYYHHEQQHKPELSCQHCDYQTSNAGHLKTHQRIHSATKPYRCKWPECDYASTRKPDTINHIRRHFARHSSSDTNGALVDPKDYLEVVHESL